MTCFDRRIYMSVFCPAKPRFRRRGEARFGAFIAILGLFTFARMPVSAQVSEASQMQSAPVSRTDSSQEAKDMLSLREALRRAKNAEDLQLIRLVDSVGWIKAQMLRDKDVPLSRLESERRERKKAGLASYCKEERFRQTTEIDSLPGMTAEERSLCKSQARLLIPARP